MTSQEIIKYYNPSIIRFIIIAIQKKEKKEIDDLWDLGWFTPQEYYRYKDKDITYKRMIDIYNNRKEEWASDYIVRSYDEGYLDYDSYDTYMYIYELWLEGEATDNEIEQAMYLALLIIKDNRLADYNDNEGV